MIPQVGVRKAAYGAYAPLLTADKLALVVIIITIIITIIVIIIHTRSSSSSLIILINITIRMMIRNQDHDDCLRDGVTRVGGGDKVAASALTSSPSPAVTRRRICHLEIVFLYVFVFSLGVKQYF